MTSNKTPRKKLRAVFLASLMVLSVFVGSVAFSGAVAAAANDAGNASNLTVGVGNTQQTLDGITASGNVAYDLSPLQDEGVDLSEASLSDKPSGGGGWSVNEANGNYYVNGTNVDVTDGSLTITGINTVGANVTSGLAYTLEDESENSDQTTSFSLVGATDVTAEGVDVTVSGDYAEVDVSHSDNEDSTEIALYDAGGSQIASFNSSTDSNTTSGVESIDTSASGSTVFNLSVDELSNNYNFELGTGTVYAASESADDSFPAVDDANFQVETDIALNGLDIAQVSGPRVAANDTDLEYEIEVVNTGSTEVTQNVSLVASDVNDTSIDVPNDPNNNELAKKVDVTVGPGNSTNITFSFNTADLPGVNNSVNDYVIAGYTSGSPYGLATTPLKVGSRTSGSLTFTVVDENSNPQEDVTVELWLRSGFDDPAKVIRRAQTNAEGKVTFTGLAVGSSDTSEILYTARAGADDPALKSTTTTLELYETTQTSDSSTLVTQRRIVPKEINVQQDTHSAVADGSDDITFTATVTGGISGDSTSTGIPIENVEVKVTDDGDVITYNPARDASDTYTTDADGEISFSVSSTEVQEVDFTFTVVGYPSITETETKNFVLSGEGNLAGHVTNKATTNGLENASVWVVKQSSYNQNKYLTQINTSELPDPDGDGTYWIRLVDNDTGQIIDNDNYDLRRAESENDTASDTSGDYVRKVEELNETNAAVGEGYALIDGDDDGDITFTHTRLADEDYYAQVSYDANNASATPGVLDSDPENFVNVTSVAGSENEVTAVGGSDPVVFTPSANLTLAATEQLAQQTGANYVDSPGFVNTYGYDTMGTTDEGKFALNKLPTNFQDGQGYVAIATKLGYTTDFADVTIDENGELTFEELQGSNELFVEPVEVEADGVDIQQVGIYKNASGQASLVEFPDKTDDTYQQVPRDGQTVDVFQVNTTADGTPVNASATVAIADTSVNGEFINIASGQYLSRNNASNTATIATGNDGQATVWYQADQGSSDINTRKTATLTNDLSVTDYSNVTFVGVLSLQAAEVSGIVTDSDNNPVPSVVYTEFLTVAGTDFTVRPAAPDLSEFTVTRYDTSGNVVETATITRAQARNYAFNVDANGNPVFPGVTVAPSVQNGFTLVTTSSDGVQESSSYTLPRVPSTDTGGLTSNNVAVTATSDASIARGNLENGTSVTTLTEPNRTATANIEISGARAAVFAISDVTVSSGTVASGDTVTVEATVTNNGAVTAATDVRYLFGESVSTATPQEVVTTPALVPGATTTVTFTLDTTGLQTGDYVHLIETEDDQATADLTITTSSPSPSPSLSRFDTNGNNTIDRTEAVSAINAYYGNQQIGGEEVTRDNVIAVISAYYSGTAV